MRKLSIVRQAGSFKVVFNVEGRILWVGPPPDESRRPLSDSHYQLESGQVFKDAGSVAERYDEVKLVSYHCGGLD